MVWSPGPVSNQPIPGSRSLVSRPVSNQPIPGAPMVSAYPPYYNQPPAIAAPDPGFYAGPGRQCAAECISGQRRGALVWRHAGAGRLGRLSPSVARLDAAGLLDGDRASAFPTITSYGLMAPPAGYFWVRYYDDAVLVDGRGRVSDWSNGIAWGDADAWAGDGYAGAWSNSAELFERHRRRPRHPAGQIPTAIITVSNTGGGMHRRRLCRRRCNSRAIRPAPIRARAMAATAMGAGSYYGAGASYGGGYYYGAPTVTTIVIQSAPVVTTTTTVIEEQVYEEEVVSTSYVIAAPTKRLLRKTVPRTYRKGKPRCRC